MKIGVVGCGAVGSFYGARLCALGEEVHFLLRSDYEAVRERGVRIHSVQGDLHVWPPAAAIPDAIGPCDLVLIGLKTTANREFPRLIPPLVGATTALLTLQNGLGNEEQLANLFGPERILGGLCFVCLNRVAPGVVQHTAHGNVLLGEFRRPPEPRTHGFADLFRRSGVRCDVVESLDRAHWEKLVWNIPFNGLGVAAVAGYEALTEGRLTHPSKVFSPCLTTDQLLDDPKWNHLVRELMFEVISTARALGFQLPDSLVDDRIARTREMGAYKASTLLDFERGREIELESLFQIPLHQARVAGVPVPRLEALCQTLSRLATPARPGRA